MQIHPPARRDRRRRRRRGPPANGGQPGVRVLGDDPATGPAGHAARRPLRPLSCSSAKARSPKRSSLPKGRRPASIDLETALKLLALPREVARHPETGEPILAGIGRYGPYVQHGKTYANLGKDDDVLEIGANRAIDLIVAKESGAAVSAAAPPIPAGRSATIRKRPSPSW